jgi:1-deoxy-D-xylulose-5-phosphate synthase
MMGYLQQINSPQDLKKLSIAQLDKLAEEIRVFLLKTVANTGGHLASNLGIVELTLALHYLLDTSKDRLVWDTCIKY